MTRARPHTITRTLAAAAGLLVTGAAFAGNADSITLDAVIRDFRGYDQPNGHPDFQRFSGQVTVGLVEQQLGEDGRPVVASLRGQTLSGGFRDAEGRLMNPAMFDAASGDVAGTLVDGPSSNGFDSVESFGQWYRDVPGVNLSTVVPLTLTYHESTGTYVFDSDTDEPYASTGGFFPINDQFYGNYRDDKNFHFTTEVRTRFVHEKGAGDVFTFTGDDDVWVFINGRLVIDLGGLHVAAEQTVELDRLDWIADGEVCTLDIFHAERRYSQSNFRVETTLNLKSLEPPATAGLWD